MKNNIIKILIVDDHPAVRSTMVDVLNEEGFQTDFAEDGDIALQKCMVNSYNFILIDVQMPKINGIEVFRTLKEKNTSIPHFIFFSAYSLPELKEEAIKLGCLAFLQKPIRIEKIISLIKDYKSFPFLVYLNNCKQTDSIIEKLDSMGFHVVKADSIDETLIQLRQINYKYLLFDSDCPGSEQESIHTTIKSLHSNTNCFETNEDESVDDALKKIEEHLHQEKAKTYNI
jgi:CheY-like chemotaxis protein